MRPLRAIIRAVVILHILQGQFLHVTFRRKNRAVWMVAVKQFSETNVSDGLRLRQLQGDSSHGIVFQARRLGFGKAGMLHYIREKSDRVRRGLLGEHRVQTSFDPPQREQ